MAPSITAASAQQTAHLATRRQPTITRDRAAPATATPATSATRLLITAGVAQRSAQCGYAEGRYAGLAR